MHSYILQAKYVNNFYNELSLTKIYKWHLRLELNVRIFLLMMTNIYSLFSKSNLQFLFCHLKEKMYIFCVWWGSTWINLSKKFSLVILIDHMKFPLLPNLKICNRQLLMKRASVMVCLLFFIQAFFRRATFFKEY